MKQKPQSGPGKTFPVKVVGPLPRWKYWLLPYKYFPSNPFAKTMALQLRLQLGGGKKKYYLKLIPKNPTSLI